MSESIRHAPGSYLSARLWEQISPTFPRPMMAESLLLISLSAQANFTAPSLRVPRFRHSLMNPDNAVLAACAEGTTIIRDAAELKVKETNRIDTVTENLKKMGADVTPTDDGMIIRGKTLLHGAVIDSYFDHRIAMAFSIAALVADGTTTIQNSSCVDVSYPDFYRTLYHLREEN